MLKHISRFFLATAFITPLVQSAYLFFPFISGKAIYFRATIELSVAFLLLHLLMSSNRRAQWSEIASRLKHPLMSALGVFTLVLAVTALTGVSPAHSWWSNFQRGEGAFQFIHYYLFVALVVALIPRRRHFEGLMLLHLGVSALVCFSGASQLLSNEVVAMGGRIQATLGNPSYLAGYLLLTIPFIAYFLSRARTRGALIAWSGLLIFETYILFWTQTRAALLALACGIFVVLVINLFPTKRKSARLVSLSLLATGAAFVLIFMGTRQAVFWEKIPVLGRVADGDMVTEDFAPRLWTWQSALSGFQERPVAGWGIENFAVAFDTHYDPRHFVADESRYEDAQGFTRNYLITNFDRAHNVFLEYLVAGGVILIIPWLAIFFWYGRALIVRRERDFWFSVLAAAPVMYLVQAFFFFDVLPIVMPLFVLFAYVVVSGNPEWEKESSFARSGYTFSASGLFGSLFIGVLFFTLLTRTAWAPLEKNRLTMRAFRSEKPSQAFERYIQALEYPSPVGQDEAVTLLAKFVLRLFEIARQKGEAGTIPVEQARSLVEASNYWFDAKGGRLADEEGVYINGAVNIEAGMAFKQGDFLSRGKALYAEALERSPNRLEFLKVLMRVAEYEGDKQAYARYREQAELLRPDIAW